MYFQKQAHSTRRTFAVLPSYFNVTTARADYNFDELDFPDSAHRKKSRRSCLYKLPLRYCISIQVRLFTRLVVSFCCFIPLVYSALSFGNVTTVSPVFHSSCSLGITVSSDGVSTCTMVLFLFFLYTRHRSTSSVCVATVFLLFIFISIHLSLSGSTCSLTVGPVLLSPDYQLFI